MTHTLRRWLLLTSLCWLLVLSACSYAARHHEPAEQSASLVEKSGGTPLAALTQRQLVRTVSLQLSVENAQNVRKKVEQLTAQVGGFVESLESYRADDTQHLSLKLRIPSDHLDAVLGKVRKLGVVLHESQQVEDITRKVVDTDARLRNLQETEKRLLALLATSSKALSDVIAVERELSRVREESEVLTSQLRVLKEQVALSTLKLSMQQEATPLPQSSFWAPWQRLFRNAGSIVSQSFAALLAFGAMLVTWFLYVLPWLPVAVPLLWLLRRMWRARKARKAARAA